MNIEENLEFDEYYDLGFKKDEKEIEKQFPYINDPNVMRTDLNEESENSYYVSTIEYGYNFIYPFDDNNEEEPEGEEDEGPYFHLYNIPKREPTIHYE